MCNQTCGEQVREWRCFFCDEVFTDERAAANHFGDTVCSEPLCKLAQVDGGMASVVADLATELDRYRREDNESFREFYRLGADHSVALRAEEQKGYDRGLADTNAEFLGLVGRISDYFHVNARPSDDLAFGYMRELDAIIMAARSVPVRSSGTADV
jgi:hypothetical protein